MRIGTEGYKVYVDEVRIPEASLSQAGQVGLYALKKYWTGIGYRLLLGHAVTTYTSLVGTSSAGSFSLAGYGSNGNGAQGGAAASGQLQQLSSAK